jgi:REP element-mobilizing transposase RayT
MANSFTQIHLQLIYAVRFRVSLIQPSWKNELYKYMTGIIQDYGHKLIAANGMPDHVHLAIGFRPTQSLEDLMRETKSNSSKWVNERHFTKSRFQWQDGYGAFSYSKSQLPNLVNYIQNQEIHHTKTNFIDEYKTILNEFEIIFDKKYIFKLPE